MNSRTIHHTQISQLVFATGDLKGEQLESRTYLFSPVIVLAAWLANSSPANSSGISLLENGCKGTLNKDSSSVSVKNLAITFAHLDNNRSIDKNSVRHVKTDGKDSLVQELEVAASRLNRNGGVPVKKIPSKYLHFTFRIIHNQAA